jgi:DNA-binding LytR/AlgR family response regulator
MQAIILEDEEMSRISLEHLCEKIKDVEIAASFDNGLNALEYLKSNDVDLIFLDVELPDFNGIELLQTLSEIPQVIFTTGNADYALAAFEYQATDYLTKPIQLPRLLKAVERAKQLHDQKSKSASDTEYEEIFVKVDGRYLKLPLDQILYIETLGDYVSFHMEDKKRHVVHSTLKGIDAKLTHRHFVKVHRSYMVNTSKIVDIEENNLVIGDKVIPISRANKSILMNKIKTV